MKRIAFVLLIALIITVFPANAYAAETVKALPKLSFIKVDGNLELTCGYNINGNNYFKLRDLAKILNSSLSKFNVVWNSSANTIEIVTGEAYITDDDSLSLDYHSNVKAIPCKSKIMIDGEYKDIKAYTINNSNYFKLRDLGEVIGFQVDWDNEKEEIIINSKLPDNAYKIVTNTEIENNVESPYFSRWAHPVEEYIQNNGDGTYNTIDVAEDTININTYDKDNKLIKEKALKFELPIFGTFYSGEKYNYIAFGEENEKEDKSKEVIRIVKYDKDFNKISSLSITSKDCLTAVPFCNGSARMAESNDKLILHTCRRTTKIDGSNYQLQLTIIINSKDMKVTNDMGMDQTNMVSFSFNQFVQFDGNNYVLVDHGNGFPRSIVLNKGNSRIIGCVDLFKIPGSEEADSTGVSVGGFEVAASNYIVAYNTVNHKKVTKYTNYELEGIDIEHRDIVLSVTDKGNYDTNKVKQITIAKYDGTDKIGTVPKLVKINDKKFAVLWQEWNVNEDKTYTISCLKYVYVDGNGNMIGQINELNGFTISECQPIVINNNITWFSNVNNMKVVYNIPIK